MGGILADLVEAENEREKEREEMDEAEEDEDSWDGSVSTKSDGVSAPSRRGSMVSTTSAGSFGHGLHRAASLNIDTAEVSEYHEEAAKKLVDEDLAPPSPDAPATKSLANKSLVNKSPTSSVGGRGAKMNWGKLKGGLRTVVKKQSINEDDLYQHQSPRSLLRKTAKQRMSMLSVDSIGSSQG